MIGPEGVNRFMFKLFFMTNISILMNKFELSEENNLILPCFLLSEVKATMDCGGLEKEFCEYFKLVILKT